MDKKSKIFLAVFLLLIIGSIGATYWRIVVKKNYVIEAQADCDPTVDKCFIWECDSEADECTGDPEEDIWYYQKISRKAANIPLCNPNEEGCEALICPEGEEGCEVAFCDEAAKTEDETCSDPETYNAENPAEEEGMECEEGDEECLSAESADASAEEGDGAACEEGDETCATGEGGDPNLSTEGAEGIENDAGSGESEEKENPAAVDTGNDSVQGGGFPLE